MAPLKSLRMGVFWSLLGMASNAASQLWIVWLISQTRSTFEVGQYGIAVAIVTPAFLFANMALRTVVTTDRQESFRVTEYALHRVLSNAIAVLVVLGLLAALGYQREMVLIGFAIALGRLFEGVSDIIYAVFQREERMDIIARSMIIRAVVSSIVFGTLVLLTQNLPISLMGVASVNLLRLVLFDIPVVVGQRTFQSLAVVARTGMSYLSRPPMLTSRLYKISVMAFPAGAASLINSINVNVPRYVLEAATTTDLVGVFTVLAYPLSVSHLAFGALAQALLPRFARYNTRGDNRSFEALLTKSLVVTALTGVVLVLCVSVAGELLLRYAFGLEYAAYHDSLTLLAIGMAITLFVWVFNAALNATRSFSASLVIHLLVLLLSFLVATIIVPELGIRGAAMVVIVSGSVQLLMNALTLRRILRKSSSVSTPSA